ncbi:zinc-binding dehydrogenase [Streptomyces clavifer]
MARGQVYLVPLPVVLGHEGAGVVEAAGSAVQKVQPRDHVAIRFLACGRCRPNLDGSSAGCANFNAMNFAGRRQDGSHALALSDGDAPSDRFFGQSSFAGNAIAHESNAVKVRKDAPLELVAPLGCGIQTGAGTVLRALKVTAGSSFAVTGAGAMGLSAVTAARVAGATTVIAVDMVPSRSELALEVGATHTVSGKELDALSEIQRITGEGVDFALEPPACPH